MRRERLLHLHGLEHHDEVSRLHGLALLDGDLDDGALHGSGHGITGGSADRGALALAAGLGCAIAARGPGRCSEACGQRDGEALAVDLHGDGLAIVSGLGGVHGAGVRRDLIVEFGLDPARVHLEGRSVGGGERRVVDHGAVEGQRCRDALDPELRERATRSLQCFLAIATGDDHLGEERVEVAADDIALAEARVDAHPRTRRRDPLGEYAGGREEAAARILAVDAELDAVAAQHRVVVVDDATLGDAELLADKVDAGDLLAHRVLDLEASVDLEEGDGAVLAHEELACARVVVAGFAHDRLGCAVELGQLLLAEIRRGRLLDELLVATLQRAVARRDDDHIAVRVGEHLRLDMAGPVEVALDEALAATESGHCLSDRRVVELRDLLDRARDLEAATATAEGGLDGDGQAVLLREGDDLVGVRHGVGSAGHLGCPGACGDVARGDLVAQRSDRIRRRSDPGESRVDDGLGEVGVLRQEAVAGMHGVGTGSLGDVDDLGDVEVGLGRAGAAEGEGLVGHLDVQGVAVRVGVDGDGGEAGIAAGPGDSDGDFATVGDEDLLHALQSREACSGRVSACPLRGKGGRSPSSWPPPRPRAADSSSRRASRHSSS